jgi:hypothetical protein
VLKDSTLAAQYGTTIDTLARLHLHKGNIQEADRLLEESLDVFRASKTGEWIEVSTLITIGLSSLAKGRIEEAKKPLSRAVDICLRGGGLRFASRLLLADAMLLTGYKEEARKITEAVRVYSRCAKMLSWGPMMDSGKVEAADGHIAAVQSLGQSTSIHALRGNVFECAVNRFFLRSCWNGRATSKGSAKGGGPVSSNTGAAIDEEGESLSRLVKVKEQEAAPQSVASAGQTRWAARVIHPRSGVVPGWIHRAKANLARSRAILLHELATIV